MNLREAQTHDVRHHLDTRARRGRAWSLLRVAVMVFVALFFARCGDDADVPPDACGVEAPATSGAELAGAWYEVDVSHYGHPVVDGWAWEVRSHYLSFRDDGVFFETFDWETVLPNDPQSYAGPPARSTQVIGTWTECRDSYAATSTPTPSLHWFEVRGDALAWAGGPSRGWTSRGRRSGGRHLHPDSWAAGRRSAA